MESLQLKNKYETKANLSLPLANRGVRANDSELIHYYQFLSDFQKLVKHVLDDSVTETKDTHNKYESKDKKPAHKHREHKIRVLATDYRANTLDFCTR